MWLHKNIILAKDFKCGSMEKKKDDGFRLAKKNIDFMNSNLAFLKKKERLQ